MLCTDSPPHDSIHSRLVAGTLRIVDVLQEKGAMLAVKRRNREISNFVANNIGSLLNEALFGESPVVRETAMKMIAFNNRTIIGAICESEEMGDIAAEIFDDENRDSMVIGNFAKIVGECLSLYPDTIDNSFSFMMDFLTACDEPDVLGLMEDLLGGSKNFGCSAEALRRKGLVKKAMNRVEEYLEKGDVWKVVGLYRVLLKCAGTVEFENDMNSPQMIEFLTRCVRDSDERVQALQWRLMWNVLHDGNAKCFRDVVDYAVEIATLDEEQVSERQVEAINFLSHLCGLDHETTQSIPVGELVEGLIRVFEKHPNHTFANGAICQFMLTGLDVDSLKETVCSMFFRVVVAAFQRKGNRVQAAFALEFGRQVVEMCKTDACLAENINAQPDFAHFCETKVAISARILKRDYGKTTLAPITPKVPASDVVLGSPIIDV